MSSSGVRDIVPQSSTGEKAESYLLKKYDIIVSQELIV